MESHEDEVRYEIGIATTDSWAAVWTVNTSYINIVRRPFFNLHKYAIREAASRCQDFSDEHGQTGSVAVIGTDGDLNGMGWPKDYNDPSEYVADELDAWTREDGGAYERATAEGYGF